jgi:hypothetical protein
MQLSKTIRKYVSGGCFDKIDDPLFDILPDCMCLIRVCLGALCTVQGARPQTKCLAKGSGVHCGIAILKEPMISEMYQNWSISKCLIDVSHVMRIPRFHQDLSSHTGQIQLM